MSANETGRADLRWFSNNAGTWSATKTACRARPAWRIALTTTRAQYHRLLPWFERVLGKLGRPDPYNGKPAVWYLQRKGPLVLDCGLSP